MGTSTRPTGAAGQAAIELLVVLPLVIVTGLAGSAILAAHATQERADEAARAGAMALLQGGDPLAAARAMLPEHERGGVRVQGRRVTVAITPRLPLHLVVAPLRASAAADAGPEPTP
jgi:hypothetical protein